VHAHVCTASWKEDFKDRVLRLSWGGGGCGGQARDTQEASRRYKELEALDPAAAAASGLLSQLTAARLAEGDTVPLVADLPPIPPPSTGELDDLEAFLGPPLGCPLLYCLYQLYCMYHLYRSQCLYRLLR
jgi:hypothetical protein